MSSGILQLNYPAPDYAEKHSASKSMTVKWTNDRDYPKLCMSQPDSRLCPLWGKSAYCPVDFKKQNWFERRSVVGSRSISFTLQHIDATSILYEGCSNAVKIICWFCLSSVTIQTLTAIFTDIVVKIPTMIFPCVILKYIKIAEYLLHITFFCWIYFVLRADFLKLPYLQLAPNKLWAWWSLLLHREHRDRNYKLRCKEAFWRRDKKLIKKFYDNL